MLPGSILFVVIFTIANIVWWRGRHSKAGVIKKYRTFVARTLAVRCGQGPLYRATDVTRALLSARVSTQFASYAYAMFCDAQEFARAPDCGHLDYLEIRRELERLS
jgi:hypothetical protein